MAILNEHFKETEKILDLPKEAIAALEKCAAKIDGSKFFTKRYTEIFNEHMFPEANDFGKCCDKLKLLSMAYGVKEYTLDMVFLIHATEVMQKLYEENGIDLEIYRTSIMDIKYKYRECVNCKGVQGVFVAWWATGFYNLRRFGLGRFQYDLGTYDGDDFTTSAGITVRKGDKILGFHIPSSGVPLTDEVRLDSYRKAYEFLTDYRRDDGLMIFQCGSWLLYPEYEKFLPENSNTIKFIKDFELISYGESEKFGDAWRVFDKWGYKSPKHWPEDTSMRRAFKKWVLDGNKTGHGHGIIVFDGEKIVR